MYVRGESEYHTVSLLGTKAGVGAGTAIAAPAVPVVPAAGGPAGCVPAGVDDVWLSIQHLEAEEGDVGLVVALTVHVLHAHCKENT